MSSSPKPVKLASPLLRKSSTDATQPRTSPPLSAVGAASASPAAGVKAGLKKLSVTGGDEAASPVSRPRLSPSLGATSAAKSYSTPSPTAASAAARKPAAPAAMSASAAAAAQARAIMKAPVQSPTAAGMKMRPASGSNVAALSSIGPSAMAAAASSPSPAANANPYSSTLNQSPSPSHSPIASASPSSPIASASPTMRRFKPTGTPTSAGAASSPQAASSPIHSAPQTGTPSGARKVVYESAHVTASSIPASASSGSGSHRGVHPPVNTHAQPPASHVQDHPDTPGGGPTIFSPVYTRTASQEQLHQAEEKKKLAGSRNAHGEQLDAEQQYRQQQQQAAQQYAQQQQQAAAQAQAQAAAQARAQAEAQTKHTVSYTPPPVEEDEFDPFLFIKHLPPLSPAMRNRRSPLPKKLLSAPKITLALDLDETLVHCSVQPIDRAELTFKVAFNGMDYEVYVRKRPYMKEFLETVSQWFEVIIFTASQKVYADKLLNILDPTQTMIKHRVFRDSCVCVDGNYLKDLHILGRDLPTVAIVDNSVQAFGFQLDNGIPIESWFDDDNDRELLNLIPFLRTLKDVKDVRPLIRDTFRLSEFVASL